MCGPLCDAILLESTVSGQTNLEYLERSNLFIVPLDNERRWYRYHHLFGDLLRKRLTQRLSHDEITALHIHASQWFENNDLVLEAFHHAAEAHDIERAERLMESKQMPLHHRDAAYAILNWLESLPTSLLDRKPTFWWKQASLTLAMGQTDGVEEKLQATEAAIAATTLPGIEQDDSTRNLIGKIAVARANLAQTQALTETIFFQAARAFEYLHPDNLSYRSSVTRTLGFAYYFKGDWAAAYQAYSDALSLAQSTGDITNSLLASIRLGQIQELRNQLHLAAETFQGVLQHIGEYSPPNSPVAYNGLAWIYYEWNDLDTAEHFGELGLQMAQRYDQVIDRVILNALLVGYIRLAKGDIPGAESYLSLAEKSVRLKKHDLRLPDIAGMRVSIDLCLGNTSEALHLAQQYDLPLLHARVFFAQGDPSAAMNVLIPYLQQAEANGFENERLRAQVLLAFAYYLQGDQDLARKLLTEALTQAEPEGFIRLFIDRGDQMRMFLLEYKSWIEKKDGKRPHPLQGYVEKILAAFPETKTLSSLKMNNQTSELIEPLSQRELEVLQLICQGLSNQEICERLYLALDTVKGHNRRIFEKLQVHRRTEAIARTRELRLF
jgi:LuxR family maltose regulon positive regulatory protein